MSDLEREPTNQEVQQRFGRRSQVLRQTLDALMRQNGVSRDVLDEAERLLAKSGRVQGGFNTEWTAIHQRKDGPRVADVLLQHLGSLDQLYDQAADLHQRANLEVVIAEEGSELTAADLDAFREARDFHRGNSKVLLKAAVGAAVASILLLLLLFWLVPMPDFAGLGAGDYSSVPQVLSFLGGRLAILGFLGWTVGHLAKMQRAHASQAVLYQDRLSGLRAAELILRKGALLDRRAVIERLSDSYLNLDANSFRRQEPPKGPVGVNLDEVDRFTKSVGALMKSLPTNPE